MHLIFGTYNFLIEKHQLQDLNIQHETIKSIEIRQVCFHLFFIPVFPYRKIYVHYPYARRKEVPLALEHKIMKCTSPRTPWYSFLFIIFFLILVIFFMYLVGILR